MVHNAKALFYHHWGQRKETTKRLSPARAVFIQNTHPLFTVLPLSKMIRYKVLLLRTTDNTKTTLKKPMIGLISANIARISCDNSSPFFQFGVIFLWISYPSAIAILFAQKWINSSQGNDQFGQNNSKIICPVDKCPSSSAATLLPKSSLETLEGLCY